MYIFCLIYSNRCNLKYMYPNLTKWTGYNAKYKNINNLPKKNEVYTKTP